MIAVDAGGTAGQFSVVGGYKTTLRVPLRADGSPCRRLRVTTADTLVGFVGGSWDAVAAIPDGGPYLPDGRTIEISTQGGNYISFKRPQGDTTTSTVIVEALDAQGGISSGFTEVEDTYFTRFVEPLSPVQGYHLHSAGGLADLVASRDAITQGVLTYNSAEETIVGGLGSAELKTNGVYAYVTGNNFAFNFDEGSTQIGWARYWDGNGNSLVVGNVGPFDCIDTAAGRPGWRGGFIAFDWNTYVADANASLYNVSETGVGALKTVAGGAGVAGGGAWFMVAARYNAEAQTFTMDVLSEGITFQTVGDLSAATGTLQLGTTTNNRWRMGAAYGLATWEGSICECYAWDRALSDAEILALFNAGNPS